MSREDRSIKMMNLFEQIYDLDADAQRKKLDEIGSTDPSLKEALVALLQSKKDADKHGFLSVPSRQPLNENMPAIGRQVGAFEIEKVLAAGGMGTVYKARHIHLDRAIALKIPHLLHPNREHLFERLRREGKALAKLDHPNVVKVYDAGVTEDEIPFIAMGFLDGESLAAVRNSRKIEEEEVIRWGTQLAGALDYLHRRQIYHRDVKTSNILLDNEGNAILADFGIAYVEDLSRMTLQLPGTPAYMCPEQLRGRAIDGRCDIYSLGLVMFELLAGQPPDDKPLKAHRPKVSANMVEIINKCIEHNPAHRYQTGHDLVRALAFNKTSEAIPVKSASWKTPALVALLAILVLISFMFFRPAEVQQPAAAGSTPLPFISSLVERQDNLSDLAEHLHPFIMEGAASMGRQDQFVDASACYVFVFEDENAPPTAILAPGKNVRKDLISGKNVEPVGPFIEDKTTLWVLIRP